MVDQSDKRSSDADGVTTSEGEIKKCADCGTSKTPLWRGGPAGPKSLCNACGIRSRKKRRVVLGLKNEEKKPRKSCKFSATSASGSKYGGTTLHQRLVEIGREVMTQRRSRSTVGNRPVRWMKLGEEEQAAVLLMALSYGSVYA